MLKETSNCVRSLFHNGKRLVAQSFSVFVNKEYTLEINFSLQSVDLFTLHRVLYFVVLNRVIFKGIIKEEISSKERCL